MAETFVQCNHSRSATGVLRGLHYHRHQADLWYVPGGRAQVGLADLRRRGGTPATESLILDAGERLPEDRGHLPDVPAQLAVR